MLSPFWAEKLAASDLEDSVRLNDVTKEEMDAFLSVLYHACVSFILSTIND